MHIYLESIGFGSIRKRSESDRLIKDTVAHFDESAQFENENGELMMEFRKEYAPGMGISVIGEMDGETTFHIDHFFPYYRSLAVSTEQVICFEKHADGNAYSGACDDMRLGATLIFYLINTAEYMRTPDRNSETILRPVCLSAPAREGSILIPLGRNLKDDSTHRRQTEKRNQLISQARGGDEKAIESLTMEELGSYEVLSKRMEKEDIYSIVDSYLIPYGVECDQYSLLGNIVSVERVRNTYTGEHVYLLRVEVCDLTLDVCINEERLEGEPAVGRRFKGLIWLQGNVLFMP